MFFFSNTKYFCITKPTNKQLPPPAKLKVFKSFPTPETNSQTYEKNYEVEEDLVRCLCIHKSHWQNSILFFCGKNNTFYCHANFIWLSYPLLESLFYEDTEEFFILSRVFNFQIIIFKLRTSIRIRAELCDFTENSPFGSKF